MVVNLDAAHFNGLLALVAESNTQIGRPELIELTKEPVEVTNFKVGRVRRQELSTDATYWLAAESVNKHIKNVLAFTSLGRWLERETWTPREALTILAGLDPARSSIEWTRSDISEATSASPIIRETCFFADWTTTFSLPHSQPPGQSKSMLLIAIEDSRELGFEDAANETARIVQQEQESALSELDSLKQMQIRLRSEMLVCISRRWFSSAHDTESRQNPTFFIQWAEGLGFQIEWVSWAREEKLLNSCTSLQGLTSYSGGMGSEGGSETNSTPNHSGPVPLTTTEIAECFCDFRWKTPLDGRKTLGKKPAWLRNCIAIPGSQGKSQIKWYPVEIGAKLVQDSYAKPSQIRSRFMTQPRLHEWLELWRDYEADYFSTD